MKRAHFFPALVRALLALMLAILTKSASAHGQTTLEVGDIQLVGATSDNGDSFSFVLWKDIEAGTVIRFTDKSFTNTSGGLVNGENELSLTFNTAISAGTVVRVTSNTILANGNTASVSRSGGLSGVSTSGDQIFIYQGTAIGSATTFGSRVLLYGMNIANTDWRLTGSAGNSSSYLPTAITGQDASIDTGNYDNVEYSGTRSGMTEATFLAAVGNIANYVQSNRRFDLETDGFSTTTSVELLWDNNGTTAGTGGTGTWDTTTQSRFSNLDNDTFLHWVNSSTGNDHTAVFGGTAGTVSIANSGVIASGLKFNVGGYLIQNNTVDLIGVLPTITASNAGQTSVITSTVVTSGSLTKDGPGNVVIAGALSGSVNVTAGTLGGGGTTSIGLAGAVTVSSGANLDPGNSPGSATGNMNTGDFSLLSGGKLTLQLGGTIPGTQYDRLNVTGSVSLAGDLSGSLIGGYLGLAGSGDKLFVIVNDGTDAVTGAFSNTFLFAGQPAITIGTATFFVSYLGNSLSNTTTGGNDVVLYAIPEPGPTALIAFGVAGLLLRTRRDTQHIG